MEWFRQLGRALRNLARIAREQPIWAITALVTSPVALIRHLFGVVVLFLITGLVLGLGVPLILGKLLGLPMGVDVCYTNHAEADADDMDTLLTLLGAAGAGFVITVPGADDLMLGYQSLSFHDVLALRRTLGLRPAPEFEAWLARVGLLDDEGGIAALDPDATVLRELAGR